MMTSAVKREVFHLIHCAALTGTIILVISLGGGLGENNSIAFETEETLSSWEQYGFFLAAVLYVTRFLTLLCLPLALFNFLGLVLFNAFPDQPKTKIFSRRDHISVPFVCFRVVTKGDFPQLVRNNILKNRNICEETGLEHFTFEVVTDKSISLVTSKKVRELVVPEDYATKSGALYKSRALQYCLEKEVNNLNDEDWIVHLDEETLLTSGCIKGIVNFICEGKHHFGQGVITYNNDEVVNLMLTLCDSIRVADDMGKLQFQLKVMHMPIMGWKGSYVISNVGAERDVSFDHGPRGSVAEDAYFGLMAASKGYSFGFIEGDMWEKSPFTIKDFLRQRKRWLQGLLLVVHSSEIPLRFRILLGCCVYATATAPLSTLNVFLQPLFPIQISRFVDLCGCFVGGVIIYMNLYGTFRSYTYSAKHVGIGKLLLLFILGFVLQPFKYILEIIAILWGLMTPKNGFAIVDKNVEQNEMENTVSVVPC
ncbi:beta-1,4-mannosyltransferase egh-like isoform X2 [Daphnia pulicaria]|nr:beta-1,4-mannosyltransferase egh-like isoform X2 [Daphnia pulicaria]